MLVNSRFSHLLVNSSLVISVQRHYSWVFRFVCVPRPPTRYPKKINPEKSFHTEVASFLLFLLRYRVVVEDVLQDPKRSWPMDEQGSACGSMYRIIVAHSHTKFWLNFLYDGDTEIIIIMIWVPSPLIDSTTRGNATSGLHTGRTLVEAIYEGFLKREVHESLWLGSAWFQSPPPLMRWPKPAKSANKLVWPWKS